ncbi:MAG: cell division/cell wall cluster transcriptional repressor MraZ [Candidatus Levybacteria bacterium CG10_big_fil_rev_8_21_14_0_10_36_30]|nr:MAG: cell division/cell wall cluster transcriptional repressor MraZ [Candidatus Levybacteria bacterium CG10_big_fil_rev_8_21_14_0_10_36_30]
MLLGQFTIKVGEKGRIAFPKRFRTSLGERLIVTFGFENSLIVVSEKNWQALLEGTEGKPLLLSGTRDTQRFLLGGASFVELDSQGRFVLPEYLRSFAKIKGEVTAVGLHRYVEIWDSLEWKKYQEKMVPKISEIAQDLVEKIDKKVNE